MNRFQKCLFLTLPSIALALLAGELAARLTTTRVISQEFSERSATAREVSSGELYINTLTGRRLPPNSTTRIQNHPVSGRDITISVNAHGFRGGPLPVPKPPGETRVLILGDSITLGSYLSTEEGWVAKTESRINAASPQSKVRLVNAGIDGIGIKEELDLLEEKGLSIEPDLVVVAWFLNDTCPPDGFAGSISSPGFLRRNSVLAETIYRGFKLRQWTARTLRDKSGYIGILKRDEWRTDRKVFDTLVELTDWNWGAAWSEASSETLQAEFKRLHKLSKEHDFPVAIIAFPAVPQVYSKFLANEPQQHLRDLANDLDFPMLDLLTVFRLNPSVQFFDWCHPTSKTNDGISISVADFLLEELKR